jgi:hypothetical protein
MLSGFCLIIAIREDNETNTAKTAYIQWEWLESAFLNELFNR